MPKYSKDISQDKRKNRPSIILPIINTIIGLVLIVLVIILKITTNILSWPLFFIFIIVMTMFPLASWYNSFFSRRQKTKMLNSYEKETNYIVEYLNHQKNFKKVNGDDKDFNCDFIEKDIDLKEFNYDIEKYLIAYPNESNTLITIGIGFFSIEVNPKTGIVEGISGLLPRSIWVKRRLKNPNVTIMGQAKITPINFYLNEKTIFQHLNAEDTYYDSHSGLLCIGERRIYPMDEVCEILKGVKLVTREQKIISIFIELEKDIPIF